MLSTGITTPRSLAPADQPPGAPTTPLLSVVSETEVFVQWDAPALDGGFPVSQYRVDLDTSSTFSSGNLRSTIVLASAVSPIADVQSITTAVARGYYLAGTFTVSYLGQKTAELTYDISAAKMKQALEALCTVDAVNVTRNTIERGHTWLVTFDSMRYSGNLQTMHTSNLQTLDAHRLDVDGSNLLMCTTPDTKHSRS